MERRKQSIRWEFEKYRQLLKEKELPCQQAEEEAAAAQAGVLRGQETLLSVWSVTSPDSPELWLLVSHKRPVFLKGVHENQRGRRGSAWEPHLPQNKPPPTQINSLGWVWLDD